LNIIYITLGTKLYGIAGSKTSIQNWFMANWRSRRV